MLAPLAFNEVVLPEHILGLVAVTFIVGVDVTVMVMLSVLLHPAALVEDT